MESFDINRFLKVLFNSKLYITFILLLFLVIGYFYSFYYVTPMYKSSATVVLVQNDSLSMEENGDSITQSDITLNQNLLSTYTKIAKSNKVLEQVIENLNLDISTQSLSKLVSVQAVSNTEVFKISVNNENNILAADIANELLDVFSNEVKSLYNMNNVYTMDKAEPSNTPFNINHVKDIAIFGVMGVIASFGLVVIIYLFDTTIKSEHDVEDYAGLSVLSTIPIYQDKNDKDFNELIVNEQPKSPISECFKTFRTNVMFSIQNKELNTILVTSGFMSEGKSFVSSNLAVTFAQSGKKVILVDTDMRKGRLHKIFGLSHKHGLSNCLSDIGNSGDSVNINEYIQKSGIPNLHVMTSGDVPPNPSELLSSPNMKKFLEALNSQYDVVICDGTPCMLVSDSIILSKMVDTTVIVTANKSTKLDTLLKIKKSIEIVGGNIGGVVINKMTMSAKSYQNKYYYGNHNEIDEKIDFSTDADDSILDNILCIKNNSIDESVFEEEKVVSIPEENKSYNLDDLSNIMKNNLKEIEELKGLYKNVMQSALNTISKEDSTSHIVDELSAIKKLYEDNILKQNAEIAALNNKISNFKQNDDSNVLDELNNIKSMYQSYITKEQDELIALNDKISNFKVEDNSDVILSELESMKSSYETAINSQNERIATLDDKVSNFKVEDNSDVILSELESMKSSYETAINSQNERIATLDDKVSNFKVEDNSDVILSQLESMKSSYETAIDTQNERIASLDDKVSNFKIEDNSDVILNELEDMKSSYETAIDAQNERIATLDDKVSNFKINDNTELLKEFSNIYKQLQIMNERFDLLEKVARDNETLIKNMNKSTTVSNTRHFDVKKLNDKVIMIQDYLDNGYNNVIELNNKEKIKSAKNNKHVLDGQIDILDSLLDNIEEKAKNSDENINKQPDFELKKNNSVIDYGNVNNKQKRIFSIFKAKSNELDDEEPIQIVSQILSGNHIEENVG